MGRALKALTFLLLVFTMATMLSQAQTHTVLHSFDWTDGADPNAGLVQGVNGISTGRQPTAEQPETACIPARRYDL